MMRLAVITLLALSAFWGFTNGPRIVQSPATVLQKAVGVLQILYALTGVLGLLALWFRPARAVPLAAVWAAIITATFVLAPIAWPTPWRDAVTWVVATAGMSWLTVLLTRAAVESTAD